MKVVIIPEQTTPTQPSNWMINFLFVYKENIMSNSTVRCLWLNYFVGKKLAKLWSGGVREFVADWESYIREKTHLPGDLRDMEYLVQQWHEFFKQCSNEICNPQLICLTKTPRWKNYLVKTINMIDHYNILWPTILVWEE